MTKYTLYNDDRSVAKFEYRQGVICSYQAFCPELLPMQIRKASPESFTSWVRDRAIDLNSLQHRNLANHLLGSRDKLHLALMTNMLSISDTFTCFKEKEFTPRVSLFNHDAQNEVSSYILLSGDTSINKAAFATPNVSTDGSFTKTWKYEKGEWWLYKIQSVDATRSEVEISKVLTACGWDAAAYRYDGSYRKRVKSLNFVKEHEFFEPYDSFRFAFSNAEDNDETILQNISSLGESFRQAWKRILIADALFLNADRHMRNFGVIRSSETGRVLRLAPNFDNNQAYKGNPGGKYSPAMLHSYWKAADEEDKENLQILLQICKGNKYLSEAYLAGLQILQH